jgi:hypothetical protein
MWSEDSAREAGERAGRTNRFKVGCVAESTSDSDENRHNYATLPAIQSSWENSRMPTRSYVNDCVVGIMTSSGTRALGGRLTTINAAAARSSG